MNRDFAAALNAKDAARAASLYAQDAVLLPPNEVIVRGRANIQAYWQGGLDAGVTDVSVKTLDAGSDGSLGYEVGEYGLSLKGPDGKLVREHGKYIEILRRTPEGRWESTHGTWNANPSQ
jgi:ketosteroid isomerase-like protein